MQFVLKKVDEKFSDISALEQINTDSFPPVERMETERLLSLAQKECFELLAAYDGEKLIGFILLASYKSSIYIFLLAIDKNMRSRGYGSKILKKLEEQYPDKQIVLDLERIEENAPNFEQRINRKKFYQRNGYFETGCFMDYFGITFEVLCNKEIFDEMDFKKLLSQINKEGFSLSIYMGNHKC